MIKFCELSREKVRQLDAMYGSAVSALRKQRERVSLCEAGECIVILDQGLRLVL